MNDPIPFFHNGDYHVFYQHNPAGPDWGDMCWGHVVSRDLVHWQPMPVALAPSPDQPDRRGCWTGSLIHALGGVYLFYTAISTLNPLRQTQSLATSADLITFEKYAGNPLIFGPPAGNGACFRDPCVWADGDGFRMLIGGEKPDGSGGQALLYRSTDLLRWDYCGVLAEGRTAESAYDFECPDFFPLGDRHVLLTSRQRQWAHLGDLRDDKLDIESVRPIEGPSFYAGKTLVDDSGRRILFGWLMDHDSGPGDKTGESVKQRGWAGVLSLPRELYLSPSGNIAQRPPTELTALRRSHRSLPPFSLSAGPTDIPEVDGETLELLLTVRLPPETTRLTLHLRHTAPGTTPFSLPITLDREIATLGSTPCHDLPPGGTFTFHLFLDRSILEVFLHGAAHTVRGYPPNPELARGLVLEPSGPAEVISLDLWHLSL